jgi:hypothetical protein
MLQKQIFRWLLTALFMFAASAHADSQQMRELVPDATRARKTQRTHVFRARNLSIVWATPTICITGWIGPSSLIRRWTKTKSASR